MNQADRYRPRYGTPQLVDDIYRYITGRVKEDSPHDIVMVIVSRDVTRILHQLRELLSAHLPQWDVSSWTNAHWFEVFGRHYGITFHTSGPKRIDSFTHLSLLEGRVELFVDFR